MWSLYSKYSSLATVFTHSLKNDLYWLTENHVKNYKAISEVVFYYTDFNNNLCILEEKSTKFQ